MKRFGINWRVFWRHWFFYFDRYDAMLGTPWFLLWLSSGGIDLSAGCRWYGIRAYWSPMPKWQVRDDERLFRRSDEFLSSRTCKERKIHG
jgi:hypothetical protein